MAGPSPRDSASERAAERYGLAPAGRPEGRVPAQHRPAFARHLVLLRTFAAVSMLVFGRISGRSASGLEALTAADGCRQFAAADFAAIIPA